MAFANKVLNIVDVVLRVPPLFIMDEMLRIGLGLPSTADVTDQVNMDLDANKWESLNVSPSTNVQSPADDFSYDTQFFKSFILVMLKFILCFSGCVAALLIFMLRTRHLYFVYMYLVSVGLIFVSNWINSSTMKTVIAASSVQADGTSLLEDLLSFKISRFLDSGGAGAAVLQGYLIQSTIAITFSYVSLGPRHPLLQVILLASFVSPPLLALLPLPASVLQHAPVFASLLPLMIVKYILWSSIVQIVQTIYAGYQYARSYIRDFGLSALVETEWLRLNVPCVLRTFWTLRVIEHGGALLVVHLKQNSIDDSMLGEWSGLLALSSLYGVTKNLLVSGCETLTAVLGMTSIVSFICHYIGCFFQWVLLTEDDDDKSIGTVSAILFYVLALQTGLTGLDPEKRFVRLCRNFCLLFTALLHFIHNIVNPLLMSLSASHNPSLHRHVRALSVCAFLIFFPIFLLLYLWSHHATSTWLLAVSAFSIEVIVKVIVSLMIYSLFLIDAYRSTFWEGLDDYVYYIRAFGNTVEFFFGIFLFFNGAWILVFESGGAIRAVMMCIHAYFNIWCEAKAGWIVFMKRRTAVNKINSLPEANLKQLQDLNDVCAICYQEMRSAKITRCKHFFHGVCLRKWLYVQDRCPLCHEILYKAEPDQKEDSDGVTDNYIAVDADNAGNNIIEDDYHYEEDPLDANEFLEPDHNFVGR